MQIELSVARVSMVQDQSPKLWQPARFTHDGFHTSGDELIGHDAIKQRAVIILNNPLENKNLLVDICIEGMHHINARDLDLGLI